MKCTHCEFGLLEIDGKRYKKDLVIDRKKIAKRKKKASKPFRALFGHTPLTTHENIPWKCKRLIIGRGMHEALPVMDEVVKNAEKRGMQPIMLPTNEAVKHINDRATNLVLAFCNLIAHPVAWLVANPVACFRGVWNRFLAGYDKFRCPPG